MRNFQVVSLVIFIGLGIFGVLVFSGAIPIGNRDTATVRGTATLWGTYDINFINPLLSEYINNDDLTVRYVRFDPTTYSRNLLEAFALGQGPDMFFLPDNLTFAHWGRIYPMPLASYPVVNFRSTFAPAGEIFLTSQGILAFPIAIDPLVMYYNRSILNTHGIIYPPQYWDELLEMVPTLTQITEDRQIVKSAAALGQANNVANAKAIISALFLQTGNPMVIETQTGRFRSAIEDGMQVLGNALNFYTDFANPLRMAYSWNRSLPNSRDYFAAEHSAFYFGFASELATLIGRNPNQDIGVAPLPQIRDSQHRITSGRVLGLAVSRFSRNQPLALAVVSAMAHGNVAAGVAQSLNMPPARRDLLARPDPTDPFAPIFYTSALYAKTWLDPATAETDGIFAQMVDDVLANNRNPVESVRQAGARINLLLLR